MSLYGAVGPVDVVEVKVASHPEYRVFVSVCDLFDLPQTQTFLITETQMAIQTDVTLQPDYTCCLRVMGEIRIAEIFS